MSMSPQFPQGGNPFAEPVNPYAAPREAGYFAPAQPGNLAPFAGLWRQDNLLVMHKLAPLPDICLKSNQPATRRLKRSLSWHHPAVYLVILLHLFLYIIVALIVRKTATIHIALTEEWFAIRRRRMLIAWGLVGASFLMFCGGIAIAEQAEWAPFLIIASIPLGLGAAIFGLMGCRMVWPKRITDQYVWLKGVHPDFLNRLEAWQWNV
jgi:hypothetical protein